MTTLNSKDLQKIIQKAVGTVLDGKVAQVAKAVVTEAAVLMPRSFILKGDVSSPTTKENHEKLYNSYISSHNKISAKLDSVPKTDADNSNDSDFRRLKIDETHNMNGVKFHELLFTNTGDLNSEIRADSIPFMRLSRDWGTFDQWQLDFRACGMASREGWAVCYFDPFKQRYFNTFVEGHTLHLPLMAIPVLVLDTWHHAWFLDFPGEKLEYLNRSMREINWNVVEMRMLIAEMAKLHQLYSVQAVVSNEKETSVGLPQSSPPVEVLGGRIL